MRKEEKKESYKELRKESWKKKNMTVKEIEGKEKNVMPNETNNSQIKNKRRTKEVKKNEKRKRKNMKLAQL